MTHCKSFWEAAYGRRAVWLLFLSFLLTGCSSLPSSGPSGKEVLNANNSPSTRGIQIVDLTGTVAQRVIESQKQKMFSEVFESNCHARYTISPGDFIEISIWEAPPTTLFGLSTPEGSGPGVAKATVIPEQMVSSTGVITVPFAGQVKAAGKSPRELEIQIAKRLEGMAHQPQVLVRLVRNTTANVTVVGEVTTSTRMPLTPRGERLLDALAAAGGVKQPVNKIMVQVTRGEVFHSMPLEAVIKDPRQNILLETGDVVTAIFQPFSFTMLGAAGKNDEINFDAQGISLVQALGRSGGLHDSRADAQGVFIFRFEPADCLDWPNKPVLVTPNGKVPVIYRANLKDPGTFFIAQEFPIYNKDLIYVSNSTLAELQKFLNIVMSFAYPPLHLMNLIVN